MALPATALITAKARQASGEKEAVDARPRHLGFQEHRWQGGLIRWRLKQAIQSVFALLDHGSGEAPAPRLDRQVALEFQDAIGVRLEQLIEKLVAGAHHRNPSLRKWPRISPGMGGCPRW